ncbi:MAG: hypothetical protein HY308_05340 [Gammaproteobacteria bacterium]|nr:hypothetical protein [Gammaproteobacteria bacterium]
MAGPLSIEFTGRLRDGFGIALWQAAGSGPEPAAGGHTFQTPLYPITAHYYIASRDYVDHGAAGGLVATEIRGDWSALPAALVRHRHPLSELRMRLPLTTPKFRRRGWKRCNLLRWNRLINGWNSLVQTPRTASAIFLLN